jgi:putative phosphoesterase
MRLGILGDTHNEVARTRSALDLFRARGVTKLIHCGDVTRPQMIQLFEGWDMALVYGNIDHDRIGLAHAVAQTPGPHHIGVAYEVALNGTRVGVCHGHDHELLGTMIESGAYDLICHGHFHHRRSDRVGPVWIVSPGALGGRYPEPRSVCILELERQTAEFIHV